MRPYRRALAFVLCASAFAPVALSLPARASADHATPFDGGDPAVRPQDDLFRHANGAWLKTAAIPGDKRKYGTFQALSDISEARVKALLEQVSRGKPAEPEPRMLGALFASLTDESNLRTRGLATVRVDLARIDSLKDIRAVASEMGRLGRRGVSLAASVWVSADDRDPGVYAPRLVQGHFGGLPDRDYYLKSGKDDAALRDAYRRYLEAAARLAGYEDAAARAGAALAFETELAKVSWANQDRRDPQKTYNPALSKDLGRHYGPFPWAAWGAAIGLPAGQKIIVGEKSYFEQFGKLAATTPIGTWRAYLSLRLVDHHAPYMDDRFRTLHHDFKGARLEGLKEAPPRWKSAIETMNWTVGEAIGRQYVARHFPQGAKAQAMQLVGHLQAAFREKLATLEWMAPETRKAALAKLDKLTVKIGYPDRWRGFEGLVLDPGDAIGNLAKVEEYRFRRDMADAGKPVDRSRWWMPPQIVNAYFDPSLNEIVFPAAILQPPFFDAGADPAYNFGGIGGVIGHEISHGFDDQGRQYDADGTLRDWWTQADAAAFEARAGRLTDQYAGYQAAPGLQVNGKLTLGENIADLTGLTMAYRAYRISLGERPAEVVGGLTGDQRFFLGWARIWRGKDRPEWLKTRLLVDPHAPEEFRTNGVVTNMDAFYEAFGLTPEDKLYKAPPDRVTIW